MTATPDFSLLNRFFDHIYVITLERAKDRQHRIGQLLAGLNFEFFKGADKNNFSIEELKIQGIYDEKKAMSLHRYHKAMNGGQVGCAWSHRLVYEDLVSKGYNKVLILEDDVAPSLAGLSQVAAILNELPRSWQLLYFDYHKNIHKGIGGISKTYFYHLLRFIKMIKWSHTAINHLYSKKYSPHLRRAGFHDFTSAYAITATAAKKLIELQTPLSFVADNLLAYACSNKILQAFVSVPKVFEQESQAADIKTRTSFVEE